MTGTLKSISTPFQDTTQVGADGRYCFDSLMVAIDIKIVLLQKGKGIHWKSPGITQSNSLFFACQSWKELPEIAEGCYHTCKGDQANGGLPYKTPSFHRL